MFILLAKRQLEDHSSWRNRPTTDFWVRVWSLSEQSGRFAGLVVPKLVTCNEVRDLVSTASPESHSGASLDKVHEKKKNPSNFSTEFETIFFSRKTKSQLYIISNILPREQPEANIPRIWHSGVLISHGNGIHTWMLRVDFYFYFAVVKIG